MCPPHGRPGEYPHPRAWLHALHPGGSRAKTFLMLRSLILLLLLVPFAARADAIRVSLDARKPLGPDAPTLQVHILEPIAGFQVKLQRSDGQSVDVKGGGRPGVTRFVQL